MLLSAFRKTSGQAFELWGVEVQGNQANAPLAIEPP